MSSQNDFTDANATTEIDPADTTISTDDPGSDQTEKSLTSPTSESFVKPECDQIVEGKDSRNGVSPDTRGDDDNIDGEDKEGQNPTNMYICQFPSFWSKHELYALCSAFGPIDEVRVQTGARESRPFRGVGFVHFQHSESAKHAVLSLNGQTPPNVDHRVVARLAQHSKNVSVRGAFSDMRINTHCESGAQFEYFSRTIIHISSFPTEWTEQRLREAFQNFGRVSKIKVLTSAYETNPSNGQAFVTFESPESAVQAVALLDNTVPPSCACPVSVRFSAVPKGKYPSDLTPNQLRSMESATNIYVTRFPNHWQINDISYVFARFGEIEEIRIATKPDIRFTNKGIAFVHFVSLLHATNAVANVNETIPEGCAEPIAVQFAKVNNALHQMIFHAAKMPNAGTNRKYPVRRDYSNYSAAQVWGGSGGGIPHQNNGDAMFDGNRGGYHARRGSGYGYDRVRDGGAFNASRRGGYDPSSFWV